MKVRALIPTRFGTIAIGSRMNKLCWSENETDWKILKRVDDPILCSGIPIEIIDYKINQVIDENISSVDNGYITLDVSPPNSTSNRIIRISVVKDTDRVSGNTKVIGWAISTDTEVPLNHGETITARMLMSKQRRLGVNGPEVFGVSPELLAFAMRNPDKLKADDIKDATQRLHQELNVGMSDSQVDIFVDALMEAIAGAE